LPTPPTSTLFPYTTLFRSHDRINDEVLGTQSRMNSLVGQKVSSWRSGAVCLFVGGILLLSCTLAFPQGRFTDVLVSVVKDKVVRSEEHTSELQSRFDLVCR